MVARAIALPTRSLKVDKNPWPRRRSGLGAPCVLLVDYDDNPVEVDRAGRAQRPADRPERCIQFWLLGFGFAERIQDLDRNDDFCACMASCRDSGCAMCRRCSGEEGKGCKCRARQAARNGRSSSHVVSVGVKFLQSSQYDPGSLWFLYPARQLLWPGPPGKGSSSIDDDRKAKATHRAVLRWDLRRERSSSCRGVGV